MSFMEACPDWELARVAASLRAVREEPRPLFVERMSWAAARDAVARGVPAKTG